MASVFFMQPLGQIAGNLVSLIVIAVSRSKVNGDIVRTVDSMWRWVVGIGVVPGVVATLFRYAIPESPRFLLDVEDDSVKAEFDAAALFGEAGPAEQIDTENATIQSVSLHPELSVIRPTSIEFPMSLSSDIPFSPPTLNSHWRLTQSDVVHYFWTEGNWRSLVGTSIAWFLLDFSFYGIGLPNPQSLARTWGDLNVGSKRPEWNIDDTCRLSVLDMFMKNSIHALVILNVGSFTGGILLVFFVAKVDRACLQKYGFMALACLFFAMGAMFITVHKEGPVAIFLYVIGQLLFNFGELMSSLMSYVILTHCRPEWDNVHDPRRNIPYSIPRNMSRHKRGNRQARLHPRPSLLRVLRADEHRETAFGLGHVCLWRLHGRWGDCVAFSCPDVYVPRQDMGRAIRDAGKPGVGEDAGEESL